jgi:hypothetical protein
LLQSPRFALHIETRHCVLTHVGVPFGTLHVTPHAPQFVSELSAVSQPFERSPSQSPYPDQHAENEHVPVAQLASALGNVQGVLHAPQLVTVVRDCSQPSAARPLQAA